MKKNDVKQIELHLKGGVSANKEGISISDFKVKAIGDSDFFVAFFTMCLGIEENDVKKDASLEALYNIKGMIETAFLINSQDKIKEVIEEVIKEVIKNVDSLEKLTTLKKPLSDKNKTN